MSFFPTADPEKLRATMAQNALYFQIPSPSRDDQSMNDDSTVFPASQAMGWPVESAYVLPAESLTTPTQSMFMDPTYASSKPYSASTPWAPTSNTALPSSTYPEYSQATTDSQCYPLTTAAWDPLASTASSYAPSYNTSPSQSDYSTSSRHSIYESSPYAPSENFVPGGSPYIKIEETAEYQRPRLYSVPGTMPPDQPLHVNPGDVYSSPSLSGTEQQALNAYTFPRKLESEEGYKPFTRPARSERPQTQRALSEESRNSMSEGRQKRGYTTHANSTCSCDQCGKLFQRSYNLKAHMETHDPNRDQPHACQHGGCKRRFVRRTDLLRHEQSVHLKERKYQCPQCYSAFARKDTLRRHVDDGCPRRPEVKKRIDKSRGSIGYH